MERAKEEKSGVEGVTRLTTEVQDALAKIAREYDLET
jgi:hypothetical protein